MSWLVQSVDLNPIELVWDELDQNVRAKQSTNVPPLQQLLREGWAELPPIFGRKNTENLGSSDSGQSLRIFFV